MPSASFAPPTACQAGSPDHWPTRARAVLAGLAATVLVGCASFEPQPGPGPEPESQTGSRYEVLTRHVVLVGDTQEHEATGYPLHENDSAVDAYVEVAQRPPEQPLFGQALLQQALTAQAQQPFIHLGDVMDLSCKSEAVRIERVLARAGQAGAILPGNHDGLLFGIYGYRLIEAMLDPDAQRWQRVCRRAASQGGEHAMSKRDFIGEMLRHQVRGPLAGKGLQLPPARGQHRVRWAQPEGNRDAFIQAIDAHLFDGLLMADSYFAQRLRLPAQPGASRVVEVIALDTNQAGPVVGTWDVIRGRSPGSMGNVRLNQIQAVTAWIDDAQSKGHLVLMAGHHNWNSLSLASRISLRLMMQRLEQPLVYLSAHTHRGFWAVHRALDRRPLLELNVSSLSDWPVAARRMQVEWDAQRRRIRIGSPLWPAKADGQSPQSDDDLLQAWEARVCQSLALDSLALRAVDKELVERQRNNRGSLMEWAVSALSGVCPQCETPMIKHALSYQQEMLDALLQMSRHLGPEANTWRHAVLPSWCADTDVEGCVARTRSQTTEGLDALAVQFRQSAELVGKLTDALDRLDTPQAQSYMACRAVQAARIDFELTPESRNASRSEANRRSEQFFRVEASVGMDD